MGYFKNIRSKLDPVVFSFFAIFLPIFAFIIFLKDYSIVEIFSTYLFACVFGLHATVFMHRVWTHKAWIPKKIFNIWGLFACTIMLTGSSVGYAAVHREHHRFSDTNKDPHSPYFKSRFRVQFLSYFTDIKFKYVVDLLKEQDHLFFAKYYWYINFAFWTILFIINPAILVWWFTVLGIIMIKHNAINTLGHNTPQFLILNSKEFGSSNSLILGYLFLSGEPYHKNHHEDPSNYNFSKKWYQFDTGAWAINLATKLKLGSFK